MNRKESANIEEIVYSAAEAAKVVKEAPESFRERLKKGEIPAYRIGSGWKIPKTLLQAYVENKAIEEAKARREVYEAQKKM